MRIGDFVEPVSNEHVLACGSGIYPQAVCVSTDPFILVSEEADMMWSATVEIGGYKTCGTTSPRILLRCLKRLDKDVNLGD